MHPKAFQKLWVRSGEKLPYLEKPGYDAIVSASLGSHENKLRYWGVVSSIVRYRGHQMVHCYNFGNISVKFPWAIHAVNFGQELDAKIVRSGTVRVREKGKSLLDQIVDPFLIFGCHSEARTSELLEPGMLLAEPGQTEQSQYFDIALPDGSPVPEESGVLFYYLMKRIPFEVESSDRWIPPGATAGVPSFRVKLQTPVVMEPGWPVLLLEKDRWFWGMVCG